MPYSRTRESRDSGITSTTTWSSRSSYDTRDSISTNITAPPSAAFVASILPPGTADDGLKSHSPWSAGLSLQKPGDSSFTGLGLTHSPISTGNAERFGLNNQPPLSEFNKRPSYANFGVGLDPRRTSDAEEAWRRQSDNAMVLSAERRRLMGSSPKSLARLELDPVKAVDPVLPIAEENPDGLSSRSAADEALLAARARILRYESHPFGSKEAQEARMSDLTLSADPRRRQSMFPHRSNSGEHTPIVDLTESLDGPSGFSASAFGPAWQDRRPQGSSNVQRDIQFDEIVRKASVDIANRSVNSSAVGTPVGTVRPLLLPNGVGDPASMSPAAGSSMTIVQSEAEIANAREREQRQRALARTANLSQPDISRGAPRSPKSQRRSLPRIVHDTAPTQKYAPRLSMEGRDDQGRGMGDAIDTMPDHHETAQLDMGPVDMDPKRRQMSGRGSPRLPSYHVDGSFPTSANVRAHDMHVPRHRSFAGPSMETHQVHGPPRPQSLQPPAQPSEAVVPYYDNPEPPSAVTVSGTADFPSVLRKDYHADSSGGHRHMASSSFDRPPPTHFAEENHRPPTQYGNPPPPYHFGAPNFDNRIPFTSAAPAPIRTVPTPAVFSLNSTTLPGPRYSCEHCGKSFSRPSSLKIHIYSRELRCIWLALFLLILHGPKDTGEKPYKCTWPNCTRSFSVQSNLKRHAKVHLENSGQPTGTSGNQTHMGPLINTALRGPGGVSTPGASASSYTSSFLTPQTAQPLAPVHTPDGYFDPRLHARHPASHSPAPAALRQGLNAIQSYPLLPAGAKPNSANLGGRTSSQLQFSKQAPSGRRVSGGSGYDSEMAEEDELDE